MTRILFEELTNYQTWQIEKYGHIVSDINTTPEGELFTGRVEDINRLAEWILCQAEYECALMKGVPVVPIVKKGSE